MTVKPVLVPAGLAASTLGAVASIQFAAPVPVRFIAVLVVLVLVPGLALTYRVNAYRRDAAIRSVGAVPFAFGIAWLVLSTEALIYARWWKPGALIPASAAFAALMVATSGKDAHLQRRASRDRLRIWGISAIGCWFVALYVWSIYRTPYRVEELGSIQTAWIRAGSTSGRPGGLSGSAMALLLEAVVPFRRSTFGTLLAARWVAFGLYGVAVVFATMWGRSFANARNLPLVFAALVGASSIFRVDVLSGVTAVSTPLLLAAGLCLAGGSRLRWHFVAAGGLLVLAGVSSLTGLGAAVGIGLWLAFDTRSWPTIRGLTRNRLGALAAGLLSMLIVTIVCSHIYSIPLPLLHRHPVSLATGRIPGLKAYGSLVLLAMGVLLTDIAASWSTHARRQRIRRHHAPLLTLMGAALGASLEGLPLRLVAPPLLLLSIVSITGLVFSSESGFALLVRSHRAVTAVKAGAVKAGAVKGGAAGGRLSRLGLVALVLLLAGLQTTRVARLSNRQQTRQMAYILERTTARDAVYDPSGEVGVLRPRVDQTAIGRAAFAVVPDGETIRDRALRKTLVAAGYASTTQPGVWAAVLQWSTNPPIAIPSNEALQWSTNDPVAVPSDETLQWSTNPPVAIASDETLRWTTNPPAAIPSDETLPDGSNNSLEWTPPVPEFNAARSSAPGGS